MLLARRYAMKLNVWGFGLAVGAVVAAAFTICAFFIAIAPQATTEFIGIFYISTSLACRGQ
jgi:hypothetical protein